MFDLTDEQKDYIRLYYPIKFPYYISEDIGVPKEIIKEFAEYEGIKKVKKNTYIVDGKKMCGRCNEWVDLEGFNRSKNLYKHPSGYQDWCKKCHKEYANDPANKSKFERYKNKMKSKEDNVDEDVRSKTALVEYTCKWCGEIKLGREFGFRKKDMKRDNVCTHCRSERAKENKIKRIKLGIEE